MLFPGEEEIDEVIDYKPLVEQCITNTNLIVERWNEQDSIINGRKVIYSNQVEAVFLHNVRKHLFYKEPKDFSLIKNRIMTATDENHMIKGIWVLEDAMGMYNKPSKIKKLFDIFNSTNYEDFLPNNKVEGLETERKVHAET